jgi:hypothetical protein
MAVIYYPLNSLIARRNTISSSFEEIILSTTPNTIIYFNTSSNIEQISLSMFNDITCSYSQTASFAKSTVSASWASQSLSSSFSSSYAQTSSFSITSSFAVTASFALGAGGLTSSYYSYTTSIQLHPGAAKLPVINGASIDAGNQDWELLLTQSNFSPTASWQFVLPPNYVGSPSVTLLSTCKTQQTFGAQIRYTVSIFSPKNTASDNITTGSFETPNSGTLSFSVSQSANTPKKLVIPLVSIGNMDIDQVVMLQLTRDNITGSNVQGTTAIVGAYFSYISR